jgi:hypothetical protein
MIQTRERKKHTVSIVYVDTSAPTPLSHAIVLRTPTSNGGKNPFNFAPPPCYLGHRARYSGRFGQCGLRIRRCFGKSRVF